MKVVATILLACFAAVALARSASEIHAEGPHCPIDDPLIVAGETPINFTLDPLAALEVGSVVVDLTANGLSTLKYTYNVVLLPPSLTFDVTLTETHGDASFVANGYLDARPFREETIPSGNITGKGMGKLAAQNLRIKGKVNLLVRLDGKVQITKIEIEIITFDNIELDLGAEITIGGKTIDWAELSKNLKANFDKDFADHEAEILERIKEGANSVVTRYTLQELLDIIDCLQKLDCEESADKCFATL